MSKTKTHRFVIVHDDNAVARLRDASRKGLGPEVASTLPNISDTPPSLRIETAELTVNDAERLKEVDSVTSVEREYPLSLIAPSKRSKLSASPSLENWGVSAIDANTTEVDGAPVKIAILDTGIDKTHPAFVGIDLVTENFTSDLELDANGHGTHVAGIAIGRDFSHHGKQVRIGVARGVNKAFIGKVLDDKGQGSTASLLQGLLWAKNMGAHVINLSLGFDHAGMLKQLKQDFPEKKAASEMLRYFVDNVRQIDSMTASLTAESTLTLRPLIFAASGNESKANDPAKPYRLGADVPAAALGVVPIGAVGMINRRKYPVAPFSNAHVRFVAPGVNIISAKSGGGIVSLSGTSMATPHVVGLAALEWHRAILDGDGNDAQRVMSALRASAKRELIASGFSRSDYGSGFVKLQH